MTSSISSEKIEKVLSRFGKLWIHPETGEKRWYINKAWEWGELHIVYNDDGSIRFAKYRGGPVDADTAKRMMGAVDELWITADGKLHIPNGDQDKQFAAKVSRCLASDILATLRGL